MTTTIRNANFRWQAIGQHSLPAVLLVALLLLQAATPGTAQPPNIVQRKYLSKIQAALDPRHRYLNSWRNINSCNDWLGLTCDSGGRVIKLSLDSIPMGGKLISQLGSLAFLTELTLSNLQLRGSIPSSLGILPVLRILDLSFNNLTGGIQQKIGNIFSLEKLHLGSNPVLKGEIPISLGNLHNLTYLILQGSGLSGIIPPQLGKLASLERLDLSENGFGRRIPTTLGNLTQLTYLDLSNNQLQGTIPAEFGNLTSLTLLKLGGNVKLSGNIPDSLGNLTLLTELDVSYCRLIGSIPDTLGNLTSLLDLQLSYNRLAGDIPSALGNLRKLQFLKLKNNILTGTFPLSFSNLRNLAFLDVSNNRLTGELPNLSNLTMLQYFRVNKNQLYGYFPLSIAQLPALSYLNLASNQFSGPIPNRFASAAIGQRTGFYDISSNYFSGSPEVYAGVPPKLFCPLTQANNADINGNNVGNSSEEQNCLTFPSYYPCGIEKQRSKTKCSNFCQSNAPDGPCGGPSVGVCSLSGKVPTCQCRLGYSNGQDPATCVKIAVQPPGTGLELPLPGGVGLPRYLNRYFRHASVGFSPRDGRPDWRIFATVDWRNANSISPIKSQGTCGACWAFASTASIESAWAITYSEQAVVPSLSEQQLVDCSAPATDPCAGGWPTDALDYVISNSSHGGLLNTSIYPYDQGIASVCDNTLVLDPQLSRIRLQSYDQVRFYGQFGLMLAVQIQPLIVLVNAESPSFRNYTQGIYYGTDCSDGLVNHAMVLVGYSLETAPSYWILRNSWGSGWGVNGYMYMYMGGGNGVCGINSLPAYYPVIKGATPCSGINPCGEGTCKEVGSTNICDCSNPKWLGSFVAVNQNDGSQTCAPLDYCQFYLNNPCLVGTCVNDMAGSYSCICPLAFVQGQRTDGAPTCVNSVAAVPGQRYTYQVQAHDSCYLIWVTYGLTKDIFLAQNPTLDCNAPLISGTIVDVSPANTTKSCEVPYIIDMNDTCASITALFNLPLTGNGSLLDLNPGLNCSYLLPTQQVCVDPGINLGLPICTNTTTVPIGGTCKSIYTSANLTPKQFFTLNPGLSCSNLASQSGRRGAQQICIGQAPPGAVVCKPGSVAYTVKRGDACSYIIFHKCKNSVKIFNSLNKNYNCQDPLAVGRILCTLTK